MPDGSSPERLQWWSCRLGAEWRLKVFLSFVLNLAFWSGYFLFAHHAFAEPRVLPVTWFDRAIPFAPAFWAWPYVSAFLLTAIIPWLISTRRDLLRYSAGVLLLGLVSFSIFAFFPVPSPRPREAAREIHWLYTLIVACDGAYNAFPSLHAAFLVYTLSFGALLHRPFLSPPVVAFFLLWSAAILISTIATRQHYFIDLLAGGGLGWLVYLATWRTSPATVASNFRSNAVPSQSGDR